MLENDFFKFLNPLFYYNYSNFLFLTDIVSEENNSFNDTNTKKHLMNNDIEYNSSKTTLLNDYILKKKNISNKQYIDNNNYLNRLSDKSLDNYNYQFISFFNYLKTHELNTRNKDNLIHFIKENNYQYADLKEYLNFYLDLFQLNYPIVFNKLNFMDNYNKINLKLDVVFNIKQSNKKLNKKINI